MKACEGRNSGVTKINALRLELYKSLNDTFHMIQELLPNDVLPEQTQKKRALLSFLGNLIHQVTGLADESQVKQIQNEINVLKKAMTGVANVMNQQGSYISSFMKTVDDRINNAIEGIKQNSLETASLAEKYDQITTDLEHFLFSVSSSLEREMTSTRSTYLTQRLDSLKKAISDLAEGKLSPLLISPQLIETTITSIQNMLIRQYPKYSLIATDPKNYFSYADFSVIRQNNSLLITIQFLISAFQKFELYKIYTFPIPINESSSHATHLQNVPDYLAITFDRQFFVGLSDQAMSHCKGGIGNKICKFRPDVSATNSKNCITNLFLGNKRAMRLSFLYKRRKTRHITHN